MLAHACSKPRARVEEGFEGLLPEDPNATGDRAGCPTGCSHQALGAAYWVNLEA